jgi:hypothetical protein
VLSDWYSDEKINRNYRDIKKYLSEKSFTFILRTRDLRSTIFSQTLRSDLNVPPSCYEKEPCIFAERFPSTDIKLIFIALE